MEAPQDRLALANAAPVREDGRYVVYWMLAQRRTRWSFGLQHAIARARALQRPLVVVEALSCSYRWASDRHHAFVVDGMRDQRDAFAATDITYHPYVEPSVGAGKGLHAALASEACLYVTDHWPCFHMPMWVERVAAEVDVRVETVDSCGILPLRSAPKAFARAYDFRRHLQRVASDALTRLPLPEPLKGADLAPLDALPDRVTERWPATDLDALDLSDLPIDHGVPPVHGVRGGQGAGLERLDSGHDYRFGKPYQEAITRRGNQLSLVRVWHLNDPGFGAEVARSFLALDRGPFESRDVRVALRIATAVPNGGPEALRAATALLDSFVIGYREQLVALAR